MKKILIILSIFLSASAAAQQTDFALLLDSTDFYLERGQYDKAISSGNRILESLNNLSPDAQLKASAYVRIARAFRLKNEFSPSLEFYLEALKELEKLNDNIQLCDIRVETGRLFYEWQVYERALEYYFLVYNDPDLVYPQSKRTDLTHLISDALQKAGLYEQSMLYYDTLLSMIRNEEEDLFRLRAVLEEIADLQSRQENYRNALKYELDILDINTQLSDSISIVTSLNNIGYLYNYLKQRFTALEYFGRSLELSKEITNLEAKRDIDVVMMNIASINTSLSRYDEALKYLYEALQIRVQKKEVRGTSEIYYEIATIYYKQSDLRNAENYAHSSLMIAKEVNAIDLLSKNYELLSDIFSTTGDNEKALRYYKQYISTRDELSSFQIRQQQELEDNQELVERKEQQLKLLIIDKEIKDLALKELQLETEKKEIDLTLLRQEKELQDITLKHEQAEKLRAEQELILASQKYENDLKANEINVLQKNDSIQNLIIEQNQLKEKERESEIAFLQQREAYQLLELERKNMLLYIFAFGIVVVLGSIFLIYRAYKANRKANLKLSRQNLEIQLQKDEIETQKDKLEMAFKNLKSAQTRLVQSEKMASLGILTAGIAHEINNPINFVYAGIDGLNDSLTAMIEVLKKYEEVDHARDRAHYEEILKEVQELKSELYFEETKVSINDLIKAIREGASRTAEIVNSLRSFSRLDETALKVADIHKGIDNTLLLLNSKINKKKLTIEKSYDPRIEHLFCYPGQLNQVFMNILSNALDACDQGGRIGIATVDDDDQVKIIFEDNGHGMDEKTKNKVFEPFFSTKDLGKGTGLGMSISFGIIQRHKGQIEVESEPSKGTRIILVIPKNLIPEAEVPLEAEVSEV